MRRQLRQLGVGCLILALACLPFSGISRAEVGASPLLISEVQTGSAASAFDEYIEMAVVAESQTDFSNWRLMYTSAVATLPSAGCQLAQLDGEYAAGSYLFVASKQYIVAPDIVVTATFDNTLCSTTNSVLSPSRGIITLLDAAGTIRDQFSYGSVVGSADVSALTVSSTSRIFERLYNPDSGVFIDTNNSALDFTILQAGNPGQLPTPVEPPGDDLPDETPPMSDPASDTPAADQPPVDNETVTPPASVDTNVTPPTALLPLRLNELLVDPSAPQTDSVDEFVEIFNPNTQNVSLSGYIIATGSNFTYRHTFAADDVIEAGGYIVLTSGDTAIALANSGGAARITDPAGNVVDETTYTAAKAGQAWARDASGTWQWTTTPTPASENIIVLLPPVLAAAVKAKAATAKKATTAAKKAAATKTSAKKASKTAVKAASSRDGFASSLTTAPTPLPGWLLALIALGALLYGAYEYRYDVANKIWQFRTYRAARSRDRR